VEQWLIRVVAGVEIGMEREMTREGEMTRGRGRDERDVMSSLSQVWAPIKVSGVVRNV